VDRGPEQGGLTTRLMSHTQSDKLRVSDAFRRTGFSGRAALILATWFGTGLMPRASGTFGTLAAIPLVLIGCLGVGWSAAALIVVTLTAFWASHRTQELLGREDPSEVVIDEAAGFSVTMFLLPLTWQFVALGFFVFRFFDIVKPWPVRQAERLKGGLGIVMDDLLAGVYAHLLLRIVWLIAG
jgi:phosphatidylglycerophosphatase A